MCKHKYYGKKKEQRIFSQTTLQLYSVHSLRDIFKYPVHVRSWSRRFEDPLMVVVVDVVVVVVVVVDVVIVVFLVVSVVSVVVSCCC